jgi:hypothetical protein
MHRFGTAVSKHTHTHTQGRVTLLRATSVQELVACMNHMLGAQQQGATRAYICLPYVITFSARCSLFIGCLALLQCQITHAVIKTKFSGAENR